MASTNSYKLPHSGTIPTTNKSGDTSSDSYKNEYTVVGDRVIRVLTVVVHKFSIDSYDMTPAAVAEQLVEWEQSDNGTWIIQHAVEPPFWRRHTDPQTLLEIFVIVARLKESDYTFWQLKWGGAS